MDPISRAFLEHHRAVFQKFGATPRGLDWSDDQSDTDLRYEKMLAVIDPARTPPGRRISLLDVGCGYGGLLDFAGAAGLELDYTGIELVPEMVTHARSAHPDARFICGNVLDYEFGETFDYVVCNGVLTQKLQATGSAMESYARAIILKMYELCVSGAAFNLMTTYVNFMKDNLFYADPAETLAFCLSKLTNRVRIDHAYRLFFEYTTYLYRPASKDSYGP